MTPRLIATSILVWLLLLTGSASAQAVIVPSPVPSCSNGDTLVWSAGSTNFVCTPVSTSQPFSDGSGLVKNASDATKILRLDVSGITTGTTRVWTVPDANITFPATIASLGANTFTGLQTLNSGLSSTTGAFSGVVTLGNAALKLADTNASHSLVVSPGSDLTADRVLTVATGDAARTITLTGSPTLSDWFDQALKTTSSPTFSSITVGSCTGCGGGGGSGSPGGSDTQVQFNDGGAFGGDAGLVFNKTTDALTVGGPLAIGNAALKVADTNASHALVVSPGSDLTADRTLTVTTGDAARTVTLSGNPTLSDWFDQSVKVAASPTFAGLTVSGTTTSLRGVAYTWPSADGSNGQALTTNGSGALSWSTVSSGGGGADFVFTGNFNIRRDTSDGSDTGVVALTAGGAFGQTRGGFVRLHGNEDSSPGFVDIYPGNVAGSKVLIATSSGGTALEITGSSGLATFGNSINISGSTSIVNTNGELVLGASGNAATVRIAHGNAFYPNSDNSLTLGASSNRWTTVWATNGTISTSDRRAKNDAGDSLGLDFIKRLTPRAYRWKADDGHVHYGLYAQDVLAIAPATAFVWGNDADGFGLNYAEFTGPIVKAIQEQQRQIEQLQARPYAPRKRGLLRAVAALVF